MGKVIGIDLGTTYSVAAWMSPSGPALIPNALGEMLTPSCMGLDTENHLLVGRAATHPHHHLAANAGWRAASRPSCLLLKRSYCRYPKP